MSSDQLYRQRRDARAATTTTSHETLALPLRPLRRHNSGTSRPLAPQSLAASFPCSRRKVASHTPPSYKPSHHLATALQPHNPEDRLQTALSLLARAAALLQTHSQPGPTHAAIESLYRFASPTWSTERWSAAVENEVARGKEDDSSLEGGETTAGTWVQRAVELLQRDGELGAYWKDGRDLGEIWEKVCGVGWE